MWNEVKIHLSFFHSFVLSFFLFLFCVDFQSFTHRLLKRPSLLRPVTLAPLLDVLEFGDSAASVESLSSVQTHIVLTDVAL